MKYDDGLLLVLALEQRDLTKQCTSNLLFFPTFEEEFPFLPQLFLCTFLYQVAAS